MDLTQSKLTKSEWESIEKKVSNDEKTIHNLIINGFDNINLCLNNTKTLCEFVNLEPNNIIHNYLYISYFQVYVKKFINKTPLEFNVENKTKNINKATSIKINNSTKLLEQNDELKLTIFEFVIISHIKKMLSYYKKQSYKWLKEYYTLTTLLSYDIQNINPHLLDFTNMFLENYLQYVNKYDIIKNGFQIMEKNPDLLKYKNIELYDHQKELFEVCKNDCGKLIFYSAPTGTGKTLSPLGLTKKYKIIFVCAARHVGLALAKCAINSSIKVAFGFGCNTSNDVRLHFGAVSSGTRSAKTGNYVKIDHNDGNNVDLIICDLQSYLICMNYMLEFNELNNLLLYWDEPTISLDYETHELHNNINSCWKNNVIKNIVLSSATLPCLNEIEMVVNDFKNKFQNEPCIMHYITSYDCRKSISIINKEGYIEVPHLKYESYDKILEFTEFVIENKILLKYLDFKELINFIDYVQEYLFLEHQIQCYFVNTLIENIDILNIKLYYIYILKLFNYELWSEIYVNYKAKVKPIYESTINITTKDTFTLEHGPTIYLTNDVIKIASYCFKTSKIPDYLVNKLLNNITNNNNLKVKIAALEKSLQDGLNKEEGKTNKLTDNKIDPVLKNIQKEIRTLENQYVDLSLDKEYIPNSQEHVNKWHYNEHIYDKFEPFTSNIDYSIVEQIMDLDNVENFWKILLLMGIGVFTNHNSIAYTEIMKELATQQKLYLIIASTDYIYGTNYQFSHAYIGNDLENMTQQKTIQALGRVGRGNVQHNYTLRFRNNNVIDKLFNRNVNNIEAQKMNLLFNSS